MKKHIELYQSIIDQNIQGFADCLAYKPTEAWINILVPMKMVALRKGVNMSEYRMRRDDTCVRYACENAPVAILQRLVEYGADVTVTDYECSTLLHTACESKVQRREKVAYLLKFNAGLIHKRNLADCTPLHTAAIVNHADVIGLLIDHGADVNIPDMPGGSTALHYAAEKGNCAAIHELIKHGADVEAKYTCTLETTLHIAVACDHYDCAKTLVNDYGANINHKTSTGLTPLHTAAMRGRYRMAILLTSHPSCQLKLVNHAGYTAAEEARLHGHRDIADFIDSLTEPGSGCRSPPVNRQEMAQLIRIVKNQVIWLAHIRQRSLILLSMHDCVSPS